jgi:hypothetical protein
LGDIAMRILSNHQLDKPHWMGLVGVPKLSEFEIKMLFGKVF